MESIESTIGIIAAWSTDKDSGFAWNKLETPVAYNLTTLKASIFRCSLVGCKAIFIATTPANTYYLRKKIGDYVRNTIFTNKDQVRSPTHDTYIGYIPIYYIPIRDLEMLYIPHYTISPLSVALILDKVNYKMGYGTNVNYYIDYPTSLFGFSNISKEEHEAGWKFSLQDGRTISDGLPLGFCTKISEIKKIFYSFKKRNKDRRRELKNLNIPILDRKLIFNNLSLQEVYEDQLKSNTKIFVENFWDVSTLQLWWKYATKEAPHSFYITAYQAFTEAHIPWALKSGPNAKRFFKYNFKNGEIDEVC